MEAAAPHLLGNELVLPSVLPVQLAQLHLLLLTPRTVGLRHRADSLLDLLLRAVQTLLHLLEAQLATHVRANHIVLLRLPHMLVVVGHYAIEVLAALILGQMAPRHLGVEALRNHHPLTLLLVRDLRKNELRNSDQPAVFAMRPLVLRLARALLAAARLRELCKHKRNV